MSTSEHHPPRAEPPTHSDETPSTPGRTAVPADALDAAWPAVARALPRSSLGQWPTPLEPAGLAPDLWFKREDLSSPHYGGNKVRCLEPVLGALADQGARRVIGTGAWGSNQSLALAIHGARHGFETGALLFPQPPSAAAGANLESLLATPCDVRLLPTIAAFPFSWLGARLRGEVVVPPGAATPRGAMGHVAAALEVAFAIRAGEVPPLRHVVLAVGSTCTTAGLLVGFAAARSLGLIERAPTVHAVRVTPWPVTAHRRIVALARGAAALLARLGGPDATERRALAEGLRVSGRQLGRGYGHPTAAGRGAIAAFDGVAGPHLDTTYAGKAGAWLLDEGAALDGPTLFWTTKSAVQPPLIELAEAPIRRRVRRWLERGGAAPP